MSRRRSTIRILAGLTVCAGLMVWRTAAAAETEARCLFVSSYHQGYEWNDGIEAGLVRGLAGACRMERFYMDTKRYPEERHGRRMAALAWQQIQRDPPDLVIAADDNASRYLVSRYLRDTELPVVFCGINWSVAEYGYPYDNATGMVEVAPVRQMLEVIEEVVTMPTRGTYLSSSVLTERKDFARYRQVFASHGIELEGVFVSDLAAWQSAYLAAQQGDFVILGNNAGINDWDPATASAHVRRQAGVFSVSNYAWMMPYTMLAMTKSPEEQGQWAGQLAQTILNGTPPSVIPIVANRSWGLYINPVLLDASGIRLSQRRFQQAVRVTQ